MKNLKLTSLLAVSLFLTACGGGSDGSSSGTNNGLTTNPVVPPAIDETVIPPVIIGGEDNDAKDYFLLRDLKMLPAEELMEKSLGVIKSSKPASSFSNGGDVISCDDHYRTNIDGISYLWEMMINGELISSQFGGIYAKPDNQGFYVIKNRPSSGNCFIFGMSIYDNMVVNFETLAGIYTGGDIVYFDMISSMAVLRTIGGSITILNSAMIVANNNIRPKTDAEVHAAYQQVKQMIDVEVYKQAELDIINEIKATTQYTQASQEIDDYFANNSTHRYINSMNKYKDRAKLIAALHLIRVAGGDLGIEEIYISFQDGNSVLTAFGIQQ